MIKRITVENYMAHKLTTVELAEGVTVITGPNNSGKSALVEAFRCVAQNPPYRHAIRHEAKNAIVMIELDSGEIIEWNRSERAATYRIHKNGEFETYSKLRKPPDDVRSLLRLDLVETETGSVDIHIGNQREPIFLLDQAGSQAASFFAASTEAAYLLKMQQALKSRTDAAKSARKKILAECDEIEKELKHYERLDAVEVLLLNAEDLYAEVQKTRRFLPLLEESLRALIDTQFRLSGKMQCTLLLERLTLPPQLRDVAFLEAMGFEIECVSGALNHRCGEKELLDLLLPPPTLKEVRNLEEIFVLMKNTARDHRAAREKILVLGKMLTPPDLREVASLDDLLQRLRTILYRTDTASVRSRILEPLAPLPILSATEDLRRLSEDLSRFAQWWDVSLSRLEVLASLESPPSLQDVRELESTIQLLKTEMENHRAASSGSSLLRDLQPPPEARNADSLYGIIESLEACEDKVRLSEIKGEILRHIQPVPTIWEIQELENLIASLSSKQAHADRIKSCMNLFNRLASCPIPESVQELDSTVKHMIALDHSLKGMEQMQRQHEQSLLEKRREVEQVIGEIGTCPLCGHSMDVDHFLEEIHD